MSVSFPDVTPADLNYSWTIDRRRSGMVHKTTVVALATLYAWYRARKLKRRAQERAQKQSDVACVGCQANFKRLAIMEPPLPVPAAPAPAPAPPPPRRERSRSRSRSRSGSRSRSSRTHHRRTGTRSREHRRGGRRRLTESEDESDRDPMPSRTEYREVVRRLQDYDQRLRTVNEEMLALKHSKRAGTDPERSRHRSGHGRGLGHTRHRNDKKHRGPAAVSTADEPDTFSSDDDWVDGESDTEVPPSQGKHLTRRSPSTRYVPRAGLAAGTWSATPAATKL